MTGSSMPTIVVWWGGTTTGVKRPSRSRGISSGTSPYSVGTCLGVPAVAPVRGGFGAGLVLGIAQVRLQLAV